MTANGYPSAMAVNGDAVQPKDQRKRFNANGRGGQNGGYGNGKEQRKDSHRRGGKDRSHDRGGKASNKAGHKATSKFANPTSKSGAPVTASGLDVQLDPKSLLGISGDLSMASTATSSSDASGHLRDICMAHVITSLADKTIGNPALMLQRLLDFSPADYDDLLLALAESGCSYVDILAAYIHNLRVVAADQPPGRGGSGAAAAAAAAANGSPDALAGGITEKFNELLSEITKASTGSGAGGPPAPGHARRASGGSGTGAGKGGGRQQQQQQQQGNRAATPDRRRNGERRERGGGGHRTASPAPPTANGAAPHHKGEPHQQQQQQQGPAQAQRGGAGRPPHPPLPPQQQHSHHHQHHQQQAPPQHQHQQQARQYAERADAPQQQHHQQGAAAELQSHLSGEQLQQQHSSGELLQQQQQQHHHQQVPVSQQQHHHQQRPQYDMISPRTSAAPTPAHTPPAHLQQQQQLYLASLTATANAAMHDLHAGLLHPGMVSDRAPPLATAAAAPAAASNKLRTYWSENLEDASTRPLPPSRADSLQPHASHQLQSHHSQSHHLQSHHSQSHHLQSHHSQSHHLQSHESYGAPSQQDSYGAAPHQHQQQFQPPQHLGGGSLSHAPVPEDGPAPPAAEDAFHSSATAQYMAELQAAALHLMPVQQHQQHQQQSHQQHQQVVLLPNGMPITLPPGGPNASQGPDMSVLQLSGDPYGTAALGLSQMSSMLSVGSSHAVQLPSFHSEPLQWSTIWQ